MSDRLPRIAVCACGGTSAGPMGRGQETLVLVDTSTGRETMQVRCWTCRRAGPKSRDQFMAIAAWNIDMGLLKRRRP